MSESHGTIVATQRAYAAVVVMQFTGLLDKNGKEIYEGDIVREFWNGNPDPCCVQVVEWDDNESSGPRVVGFYLQDGDEYEVIGNIYENPELLLT